MAGPKQGDYVVVRGENSGAFVGVLAAMDGRTIVLDHSIRLWFWSGAASLSQLAVEGVSRPDQCKFPPPVDGHAILDVIEVMPATAKAKASIAEVKPWRS